jgi:hypothetical protein
MILYYKVNLTVDRLNMLVTIDLVEIWLYHSNVVHEFFNILIQGLCILTIVFVFPSAILKSLILNNFLSSIINALE